VTIVRKSCDARRTRAAGDQQDGTGSSLVQPVFSYVLVWIVFNNDHLKRAE